MNQPSTLKISPNTISQEDCRVFKEYIDNNIDDPTRFRSKVGHGWNSGVASRAAFPDRFPPNLYKELEGITNKYADLLKKEIQTFYNTNQDIMFYGISITRLTKDIQLRIHQDIHDSQHYDAIKYSVVLYLDDDYEGGELVFISEEMAESIKNKFYSKSCFPMAWFPLYEDWMDGFVYRPKSGDALIFHGKDWHGSTKILGGTRDAIILWYTLDTQYQFPGFDSDKVSIKYPEHQPEDTYLIKP